MEKIKNAIERTKYVVFAIFLAMSLLSALPTLNNSVMIYILKGLRYLCYAYFLMVLGVYYRKISYLDIFVLILGILVFIFSKNQNSITTVLVIISMKNYDMDKIFKISFYAFAIFFTATVLLSLVGIIPDWTYGRGTTIRHSLGFIYPTDCHGFYLATVLLYFASFKEKNKATIIVVLELINIILFIYTNGRLSFILITTILVFMLLLKTKTLKRIINAIFKLKVSHIISLVLPFLFLFLFLFTVNAYKSRNEFGKSINSLLSNRVKYTYEAFQEHEIKLFGENIKWYGWGGYGYDEEKTKDSKFRYNYVDSSYPRILLDYGVVFSIVILISYSIMLIRYKKNSNLIMYFVFVFVLIWAFVEPSLYNLQRNVFVLAFSVILDRFYIFKKEKKLLDEKINN